MEISYLDTIYEESNCFINECTVDMNECDTQVFVTWAGRDNEREDCVSDNYRLSDFYNYGIVSYINGAKALSE